MPALMIGLHALGVLAPFTAATCHAMLTGSLSTASASLGQILFGVVRKLDSVGGLMRCV
jgi:hypothetical protein